MMMAISSLVIWRRRSRRDRPVEAFAHFLAGLEEWHALTVDRHVLPGPWVAPSPCRAVLDRKRPESAQFHAIAAGDRGRGLDEDLIDDVFDIALVEVGVLRGNALNEL